MFIGWRFPENNGGSIEGFNDAGIETFRGNRLVHLAREIIQNSLDAANPDAGGPVRVKFKLEDVPSSEFPGIGEYRQVLNKCLEYWSMPSEGKIQIFLDRAIRLAGEDTIPFLRISDFNTTGLTGANLLDGGLQHSANHWYKLIKGSGVSGKPGGAGGSYGIGKNAPFACSNLRTVFYASRDTEGIDAFQGVCKLAAFKNEQGELTRSTGYFGMKEGNRPITDPSLAPGPYFTRSQVGTDILIAGFEERDGWEADLKKSVIDNFFVALMHRRLEVIIESTRIDAQSLPSLLEKVYQSDASSLTSEYYRALTSPEHTFTEDNFLDCGRLRLKVVTGRGCPRRVAMVRGTGMKIFDKGHFRTPIRFAAVLIAEGNALNEILRLMEPPAHDAWEPQRHDNEVLARGTRDSLYRWLNNKIGSISDVSEHEHIDIEGISQYLPDDTHEPAFPGQDTEGVKGAKPVTVEVVKGAIESGGTASKGGTGEKEGVGEGSGNSGSDGGGTPGEAGDGRPSSNGNHAPIALLETRLFCVDESAGEYQMTFVADYTGPAVLRIIIVGEDRAAPAQLKAASLLSSGKNLHVAEDRIGPLQLVNGERTVIRFTMQRKMRYALEVVANAYS